MMLIQLWAVRSICVGMVEGHYVQELFREESHMKPTKTALITGITGQDGSYLAELLLEKGYQVHGIKRRASSLNTSRIDHLYQDPHETSDGATTAAHASLRDLTDSTNLIRIIQQVQPDEIYNLGAQSHVAVSLRPDTANCDALGMLHIGGKRILGLSETTRIYQASTSELYGLGRDTTEEAHLSIRSPTR